MSEPILSGDVHIGQHDDKLKQLLAYCERSWRIFPLWERDANGVCKCREREACDQKHPRVKWQNPDPGRSGATSDWDQVQEWHREWPDADWAVALDDLFVVDVDRKHGGMATLDEVEENWPGLLDVTLVQETPSGGRQFFYRQPPEYDIFIVPQGRLKGLNGFEVKGLRRDGQTGSYVGIPPSRGRRWLVTREPAEASPDLLREVRGARPSSSNAGDWSGDGEAFNWTRALTRGAIPVGERDKCLYDAACSLRSRDETDSLAIPLLRQVVANFPNSDGEWKPEDADAKWEHVKKSYAAGRSAVEPPQAFTDWMRNVPNPAAIQLPTGSIIAVTGAVYEKLLHERLLYRMADRQAIELVNGTVEVVEPPTGTSLADLLDEPLEESTFRIAQLLPTGGRVILAAARKAGKTTLVGNLAAALVDGEPFLRAYDVVSFTGNVGVIDTEMARAMLRDWYRDIGIVNPKRLFTWTLRGKVQGFDIRRDAVRELWVKVLQDAGLAGGVLIIDCLAPIYNALGIDEDKNTQVGPFLDALDALLVDAGVSECVATHHMGHGPERSRGASRMRDWPEAEWKLLKTRDRDGQEVDGDPRYLWAYGRDVDVPETQLAFDANLRRLALVGGNRKDRNLEAGLNVVLAVVTQSPGLNKNKLTEAIRDAADGPTNTKEIHELIGRAVSQGRIYTEPGPNRQQFHRPGPHPGVTWAKSTGSEGDSSDDNQRA